MNLSKDFNIYNSYNIKENLNFVPVLNTINVIVFYIGTFNLFFFVYSALFNDRIKFSVGMMFLM